MVYHSPNRMNTSQYRKVSFETAEDNVDCIPNSYKLTNEHSGDENYFEHGTDN